MCLKCFWLKVEHLDISESSSDWAEQRFQIEIWAKSEAGGAYSGGACIKKACLVFFKAISHFKTCWNPTLLFDVKCPSLWPLT